MPCRFCAPPRKAPWEAILKNCPPAYIPTGGMACLWYLNCYVMAEVAMETVIVGATVVGSFLIAWSLQKATLEALFRVMAAQGRVQLSRASDSPVVGGTN